jgi:hypothetical protein
LRWSKGANSSRRVCWIATAIGSITDRELKASLLLVETP